MTVTGPPFKIRSRVLIYPLPPSVSPKALQDLLSAQIGVVHRLTPHQVSSSEYMAEILFEHNVATLVVNELNNAVLDGNIKITVIEIYRGAKISDEEINQVKTKKSLEPLRARHMINSKPGPEECENIISTNGGGGRNWWERGGGISRYELDRELERYRENDDRMDLDRYGN